MDDEGDENEEQSEVSEAPKNIGRKAVNPVKAENVYSHK